MQVTVQGLPLAFVWQDLKALSNLIGQSLPGDIVMGQDGPPKSSSLRLRQMLRKPFR